MLTSDEQSERNIGADAQDVNISQTVVDGSLETAGGDFVGRDKVNINAQTVNIYPPQPPYTPAIDPIGVKLTLNREFQDYTPQEQEKLLKLFQYVLQSGFIISGIE